MKIGPGVSELWGRKSLSPIDKAHGLYNSLYYRTSRDDVNDVTAPHVGLQPDWTELLSVVIFQWIKTIIAVSLIYANYVNVWNTLSVETLNMYCQIRRKVVITDFPFFSEYNAITLIFYLYSVHDTRLLKGCTLPEDEIRFQ